MVNKFSTGGSSGCGACDLESKPRDHLVDGLRHVDERLLYKQRRWIERAQGQVQRRSQAAGTLLARFASVLAGVSPRASKSIRMAPSST